jgi:hypothetical protein
MLDQILMLLVDQVFLSVLTWPLFYYPAIILLPRTIFISVLCMYKKYMKFLWQANPLSVAIV